MRPRPRHWLAGVARAAPRTALSARAQLALRLDLYVIRLPCAAFFSDSATARAAARFWRILIYYRASVTAVLPRKRVLRLGFRASPKIYPQIPLPVNQKWVGESPVSPPRAPLPRKKIRMDARNPRGAPYFGRALLFYPPPPPRCQAGLGLGGLSWAADKVS